MPTKPLKPVYLKIIAKRRGGASTVERYVKISHSNPILCVDVQSKKIATLKGIYSTPYVIHPSNKRQFEKAMEIVTEYHKQLNLL